MSCNEEYLNIIQLNHIDQLTVGQIATEFIEILCAIQDLSFHKGNKWHILRDEKMKYYVHKSMREKPYDLKQYRLTNKLLTKYTDLCFESLLARNRLCCWKILEPLIKDLFKGPGKMGSANNWAVELLHISTYTGAHGCETSDQATMLQ